MRAGSGNEIGFERERAAAAAVRCVKFLTAVSGNATNSSTYFLRGHQRSQEIQENTATAFCVDWTLSWADRTLGERSLNSGVLKGKVCRLLERTPDFQRESTRLCKKSKKSAFGTLKLWLSEVKIMRRRSVDSPIVTRKQSAKARMFLFVEKAIASRV